MITIESIESIEREDPAIGHDLGEFARHYQIPADQVIDSWLGMYRSLTGDYQTSDVEVLRGEIRKRVREMPNLRLTLDIVSVPE